MRLVNFRYYLAIIFCLPGSLLLPSDAVAADLGKYNITIYSCPGGEGEQKCNITPGVVIGTNWIMAARDRLKHCLELTEGGSGNVNCYIVPNRKTQTKYGISKVWVPDTPDKTLFPTVPASTEDEAFSWPLRGLDMAILESHVLHFFIENGSFQIAPLAPEGFDFGTLTSAYTIGAKVMSPSGDHMKMLTQKTSLEYPGWYPDREIGNVRYAEPFDKELVAYGGVFSGTKKPFLVGYFITHGYTHYDQYFASVARSQKFIKKIIKPWRWQKVINQQLPRVHKDALATLDSLGSGSLIPCRADNRPGVLYTSEDGYSCVTIDENRKVLRQTSNIYVLTGSREDQIHWRQWHGFIPEPRLIVQPKTEVTCDGIKLDADYSIKGGYSRFGIKRSDYGYDQTTTTLCLVKEHDRYYLGGKDKSSDLCAYVKETVTDPGKTPDFDVAISNKFMRITGQR